MLDGIKSAFKKVIDKVSSGGKLTEDNLKDAVRMIRTALLEADVNFKVAKDFAQRVKVKAVGQELIHNIRPGEQFIKIVNDELITLMGGNIDEMKFNSSKPTVVMMAGLNGSGKTTTCGKFAQYCRKKYKKNPLMVACDLMRPAAIEQLEVLGKQINIDVYLEDPKGKHPKDVAKRGINFGDKNGNDLIIVDTAGRLQIDELLMKEVEEIQNKIKPDYVFLVVDGMTGQDAVNSAKGFNERLEIDGVVMTKFDGDTRGGAALSVREVTGKPIRYLGTGEKLTDFEEFRPEGIAERILGMGDIVGLVNRVQEEITEEEAEEQMFKMLERKFTFEDFLGQLEMISRLGDLNKVMDMMPTQQLGLPDGALDNFDPKQLHRVRAIIESMTRKERRLINELDPSRKRRIARGSGVPLPQVNEVVKGFKQMQKQMQQFLGASGGGLMERMGRRMLKGKKMKSIKNERKDSKEKRKKRKIKRH